MRIQEILQAGGQEFRLLLLLGRKFQWTESQRLDKGALIFYNIEAMMIAHHFTPTSLCYEGSLLGAFFLFCYDQFCNIAAQHSYHRFRKRGFSYIVFLYISPHTNQDAPLRVLDSIATVHANAP